MRTTDCSGGWATRSITYLQSRVIEGIQRLVEAGPLKDALHCARPPRVALVSRVRGAETTHRERRACGRPKGRPTLSCRQTGPPSPKYPFPALSICGHRATGRLKSREPSTLFLRRISIGGSSVGTLRWNSQDGAARDREVWSEPVKLRCSILLCARYLRQGLSLVVSIHRNFSICHCSYSFAGSL